MNRKYILLISALVLILGGFTLFLHFQSGAGYKVQPTPTPYKAPPRSEEAPLAPHRAQSSLAATTVTNYNPWGVAIDEMNGFVWVAEPGCDMAPTCLESSNTVLGKFSQADGSLIQEYQQPTGYSNPLFLAVDSSGKVWFTEPNTDAIGVFDPLTTEFAQYKLTKGSVPYDIVVDHNGNLWFSEFSRDCIGFLNAKTHALVETPIPTPASDPYGMTVDAKGTVWFVENEKGLGKIGSFTPTVSGKIAIQEHEVNTAQPHLITSDKNGNIWISEAGAGQLGRYNPATGTTTNYEVTPPCLTTTCHGVHVSGVAVDKAGRVWFTDSLAATIGYINPATGAVTKKVFADANAHPHDGLAIDQYGTIWFSLEYGRSLNMWPNGQIPAR